MFKGRILSIAALISLLVCSCDKGDFDYSKYYTVKGQQLLYTDTMEYGFIPKENNTYSLYLSVRYSDEYEFSNVWWKVTDKDITQRVEVPLFDKAGKPLGQCTGGLCTQTILWKKAELLRQDTLNVKIVQNMRRNPLNYISEVGLIAVREN